jgi:hypothetical protein
VLLSFDDGYQSMYSKVFPILKQFKAPAVVALVGSWLSRVTTRKCYMVISGCRAAVFSAGMKSRK